MKSVLASFVLSSATLLAASSAFAGSSYNPFPSHQRDTRPACSALPSNTDVYGICHQECGPAHDSGGGMSNKNCEDNCLSRYCKIGQ